MNLSVDQIYNKRYKVHNLLDQHQMETITKKTVSVEVDGKKYVLPDDVTLGMFLVQLGLSEDTPVKMITTKEGFSLIPQI